MSQPEDFAEQRIDRVLAAGGLPRESAALRVAVLSQTVAVICRRRRLKQCVLGATLLGFYLAGLTTAGLWQSPRSASAPSPALQVAASPLAGGAARQPRPLEPVQPAPARYAGAARHRPAAAGVHDFRALQRSADRQLLEYGDVESAVRGYSRILDRAPTRQQVVSADNDTWLLMALKNAKSKELRHERVQD